MMLILSTYSIKELVFKEKPGLDVFVLSTHTAIFQLLFYPLFVPISVLLHQTGTQGLLEYIKGGFRYGDITAVNNCLTHLLPELLLIIFAAVSSELLQILFQLAPARQIRIHIWSTSL